MSTTLRSRTLKATSTWDRDRAPETKPRQGDSKKNHGRMDRIRQAPRHLQGQHLLLPAMTYGAETWALTTHANIKLAAAQTKMERSMLNITYRDRKTTHLSKKKDKGHRRD